MPGGAISEKTDLLLLGRRQLRRHGPRCRHEAKHGLILVLRGREQVNPPGPRFADLKKQLMKGLTFTCKWLALKQPVSLRIKLAAETAISRGVCGPRPFFGLAHECTTGMPGKDGQGRNRRRLDMVPTRRGTGISRRPVRCLQASCTCSAHEARMAPEIAAIVECRTEKNVCPGPLKSPFS